MMEVIIEKTLNIPSPITVVSNTLLEEKGIILYIKRDDLIHKDISGNKWRKLKYNLLEAKSLGKSTLVSFGGAFSNHLSALAAAGKIFGFDTIGFVRSDHIDQSNPTIQFLRKHDMSLRPLSRTQFRDLENPTFISDIKKQFPNSYIVPMGGTNALALKGINEMMTEINEVVPHCDYFATPIGSGGTAAGIISNTKSKVLVFNTFKKDFTKDLIEPLIGINDHWQSINDYHFGGFAKTKPALFHFIKEIGSSLHIPFEHIYNGKMMYGLMDMIRNDYFKPGTKIVAIHTGGLQGRMKEQNL